MPRNKYQWISTIFFAIGGILSIAIMVSRLPKKADYIVFEIKLDRQLPDGRPVISIRRNDKKIPAPYDQATIYSLLVRKNGKGYYQRTIIRTELERGRGSMMDLAIQHHYMETDKLTVAIELPRKGKMTMDDAVQLSNVVDLPHPPKTAPVFAVPPTALPTRRLRP